MVGIEAVKMKLVGVDELPFLPYDGIEKDYTALGVLPDGRICGVHRLAYHWTMHIDIGLTGIEGRYCFGSEALALLALHTWDGSGDPIGWHKHYPTRKCDSYPVRRCRDVETGEIYLDGEISPRDLRMYAARRAISENAEHATA